MDEPERGPNRPGAVPTVGQYVGAAALLLVLVPALLRRLAGDTSTVNTLLLVGSVCLLAANAWTIARHHRQRRDRP